MNIAILIALILSFLVNLSLHTSLRDSVDELQDEVRSRIAGVKGNVNKLSEHLRGIQSKIDKLGDDSEDEFGCEQCDRVFDSKRGRSLHVAQTHEA